MTASHGSFAAGTLLVGLLLAAPLVAQEPQEDLRQEIEQLKKGQEELRKELAEVKKQLQRPAPAQPAGPNVRDLVLELGANPVQGETAAPLTLIELTDYQCPYCSRHASATAPQIEEQYVATGKLRHVVIDLPLAMHKLAFKAAEATACAGEQGKYWQMHEHLFANQKQLEPWAAHAEALGLDPAAFEQCLGSDRHAPAIRTGMALATRLGISGTPSFILARTDPNDPTKVTGLSILRGAQPFSAFKGQIDVALGEVKKENP